MAGILPQIPCVSRYRSTRTEHHRSGTLRGGAGQSQLARAVRLGSDGVTPVRLISIGYDCWFLSRANWL
jgi:hypothetical protein